MAQLIVGISLGILVTALTTNFFGLKPHKEETRQAWERRVLAELSIYTVTMWMLLLVNVLMPVYMLYISYSVVRIIVLAWESHRLDKNA